MDRYSGTDTDIGIDKGIRIDMHKDRSRDREDES